LPAPIAAAGGVLWRRQQGTVEIAAVHRPRYDDWSLPKGKVAVGEPEIGAAVREVGEETGSRVAVSRRVGRVRYVVGDVPKTVTYWAMQHIGGTFAPNAEVDDIEWLSPSKVRKRLSYDLDRGMVEDFASLPPPDSVVALVRHARAGKRRDWPGDDNERPLDETGVQQALHMTRILACFGPRRVISAEPLRCIQTVEPLAAMLGLPVDVDPVFGDECYLESPSTTMTAMHALLAKPGEPTVVCSQGVTIPSLVDALSPGVQHADTRKGAAWVLSAVDGDVIAADYYDASPSH
jgi:8-oxo-dGTP pyrophosphatase MutT (NUDIX family)/phosphohistidine phosphatase SixA